MWPFKCKQCELKDHVNVTLSEGWTRCRKELNDSLMLYKIKWQPLIHPLHLMPPINTNLLVANKDFTYFGFIYMEDGWDYSRQINMQGKDKIWATYTNVESVHWWLNLDEIKK